jgi:hypothetical protein
MAPLVFVKLPEQFKYSTYFTIGAFGDLDKRFSNLDGSNSTTRKSTDSTKAVASDKIKPANGTQNVAAVSGNGNLTSITSTAAPINNAMASALLRLIPDTDTLNDSALAKKIRDFIKSQGQ